MKIKGLEDMPKEILAALMDKLEGHAETIEHNEEIDRETGFDEADAKFRQQHGELQEKYPVQMQFAQKMVMKKLEDMNIIQAEMGMTLLCMPDSVRDLFGQIAEKNLERLLVSFKKQNISIREDTEEYTEAQKSK